jgi:hypothetical protein
MTKEFEFLYRLQASGKTNMLGAGAYLQRGVNIDSSSAKDILLEWMDKWDQKEYDEANRGGK